MNQRPAALRAINPMLLATVLGLVVFGTVVVSSAVSGMEYGPSMVRRHIFGLVVGLIPLGFAWVVDYRRLTGWLGPLFIADAVLIISPRIPGLGVEAGGATSWLQIAGHRLFQPSEPAKLLTIIILAAIIARYKGNISKPGDVGRVVGILALLVGLILLQPDLGTGMVFVAIAAGMMLVGGLQLRWFGVFALVGIFLIGSLFRIDVMLDQFTGEDRLIKEYQRDRLTVFVDPTADPDGAGYNLAQSKIAIGSGELTGKGLGSGTQGNLNFLPERHTDFIFSVLGEELGFTGALLLLGLYLALLITALEIAASSRDLFGALIAAGVISMWTFQILENIGMTIGLMPITGIPLPFMSFGSSFMVTNMAAVGMLLSVWTRRYA